jgi:hypothetical protein
LLLNGSYREETGRQLAAACSELSQLVGWVAYDSGEHGVAQRYPDPGAGLCSPRRRSRPGAEILAGAFNLALLATACAAQDEPEWACAAGRQALDLTVRLTSARSVGYVRDLVRRPRADVPAVRDFTSEVAERLPASGARAAPSLGDRAENVPAGDHGLRLLQDDPAHLGRSRGAALVFVGGGKQY